MGRLRFLRIHLGALLATLIVAGCASDGADRPRLKYEPDEFREAIRERVPELGERMATPPFLIDPETIERARQRVMAAPRGPARVEALVDFLTDDEPDGLALRYNWAVSAPAQRTIDGGQGNCVSLASVLVGLGRGLGWPMFYAEARRGRPETLEFEEITALSDHMVVIVVARTVQMIIDFTGLVEPGYDIDPIDDLTAYAHLVNNIAGQRVMSEQRLQTEDDWESARAGFELATRIQPELGRAWNNLGIVLARLGRYEEAREAYGRALSLDTVYGSPERNLTIMETRAAGETTLLETPLP